MSSQRKRKKGIIDELFGGSIFNDMEKSFGELPESGYSVSVVQTPEGIKVRAKVGKDTDVNTFRKELQQKYPNAAIEIEGGSKEPLIREISTKSIKKENNENQNHK